MRIAQFLLLTLVGFVSVTQAQTGAAPAAAGKQKLVIIGASYAADLRSPALARYTVINKGVGGEVTSQVAARFQRDVVALEPAAVIIWGHINNIHGAPGTMDAVRAGVQADFEQMIRAAQARGIRVMLATEVTLTEAVGFKNKLAAWVGGLRGKEGYSARVNREVRALNDWLRGYARQHGIQLLDFEKVLDDGAGFRREEFTSEDGTHVSAEGYAALTRYLQAQLPG